MTITDGRGLIERIRTALSRKSLEALQTSPQTLIDDKAVDVNIAPASSDGDRIAILDADRPATAISDSYLAPGNLALAPWTPRRALLIGACFLFQWADYLKTAGITTEVDRILFANVFRMPPDPPSPATDYDFALAQVPLASVCPELDHARLAFDDVAGHEALFEDCVARLDLFLQEALVWSDRIPTFVMTYLLPQQDLLGRLQPRYDLRNPAYFVDRLNMELERLLRARPNAYLLDANGIAATYGRRYVQEDALWTYFHGGINEGMDRLFDTDKSVSVVDFYDVDLVGFVTEIWYGACASYRSLKGLDAIKMLCVDLDDTLWRGTIGELEGVLPIQIIGWPTGLLEALLYLKKRGVLLAILSKNDESRVRSCWDRIFEGKISIDDFAVVKINWKPKAENMAEAISDANLLPQNVAFLDDNPVERHAIRIAFPQVRIIEGPHFLWRRILGWSAEFQAPEISKESGRRTELVQARIGRERERASLSREAFLASLHLNVTIAAVQTTDDPRFARAFELINKTNQFNTSGTRWSHIEARNYLGDGGTWWTFDVGDRFSHHGMVGVLCIQGERIDQFVMSCRIAGLDVELAAVPAILTAAAPDGSSFRGKIVPTDYNAVIRDLYARLGWEQDKEGWRGGARLPMPNHIRVAFDDAPDRPPIITS